jgi:hypothetical protein
LISIKNNNEIDLIHIEWLITPFTEKDNSVCNLDIMVEMIRPNVKEYVKILKHGKDFHLTIEVKDFKKSYTLGDEFKNEDKAKLYLFDIISDLEFYCQDKLLYDTEGFIS